MQDDLQASCFLSIACSRTNAVPPSPPAQFGMPPDTDYAQDAATFSLEVQPGDAIVMATDGLLDNLYGEDIVRLAPKAAGEVQQVRVGGRSAVGAALLGNCFSRLHPNVVPGPGQLWYRQLLRPPSLPPPHAPSPSCSCRLLPPWLSWRRATPATPTLSPPTHRRRCRRASTFPSGRS
jgi:hypothetical protein